MTDTILKQNAGRGGAVIVAGTDATIPAGNYSHVEFLATSNFSALPSPATTEMPLLTGLTTGTSFPANSSLKTTLVIGASSPARFTGTAVFYKAIID
jgi:hypothetical protein